LAEAVEKAGWFCVPRYNEHPPDIWVFSFGARNPGIRVVAVQKNDLWGFYTPEGFLYACAEPTKAAILLNELLEGQSRHP
jgi:hypothetical protein